MKKSFLFICLFLAFKSQAQEGIKFHNSSWKEAIQMAFSSNKLIFVDCNTAWCMPCKWMEQNVFVKPEIGTFFNAHFINTKMDMEKGDGIELRKKYNVQSFPTFLFINANGEVIHRTASRMSAEEFLAEGKRAADPSRTLSALQKAYEAGKKDLSFLLDYYLALERPDRAGAERIGREIISGLPDAKLNTALGWKITKALARNEKDRLGSHFMANPSNYVQWSTKEEREQLTDKLITSTMYGYTAAGDKESFMKMLPHFKNSDQPARKKQGIMLEADFYLEQGNAVAFKKLTDQALAGLLKNDAEKLSFLARRADYKGAKSPVILQQAYLMAKRAAVLEPEEYSVQGTLATVCLSLKKKDEGLIAAKKARNLADAETSKIQKIAQNLLDKIQAL